MQDDFKGDYGGVSFVNKVILTKSDLIAMDNEKCFHSSLRLRKLIISELVHLQAHIRSLRSTRWSCGRLTSPRN